MNKPPLVSVLVPIFNRESYISECIQSVLNQNYPNIEIIIVDNASTDGTWDHCLALQAAHSQISVYQNSKNLGPVRNWIECVSKAKGDFGKILFSDDTLLPGCISQMVEAFLDNEQVSVVSSPVLIGRNLIDAELKFSKYKALCSQKQYIENMIAGKMPVSPGAMLFKLDDLRKHIVLSPPTFMIADFEGHGAGPDVLLILLSIGARGTLMTLPQPLTFFRSHGGSFTEGERKREVHDGYRKVITKFLAVEYSLSASDRYLIAEYVKDILRGYQIVGLDKFFSKYYGNKYSGYGFYTWISMIFSSMLSLRLNKIKLPVGKGIEVQPHV
jgi:glycosyltransferase involved in cell wall biosynthesis